MRSPTSPDDQRRDVAGILADRLAAFLIHHEPGWKLPRLSVLARRYNVRPIHMEQAIRELTARHLIRQHPDGQMYRASPADLLIEVADVAGLAVYIDPMSGELTCRNRKVCWERLPENIGRALGVPRAEQACIVKCQWSVNREPAAISATYLTEDAALQMSDPAGVTAGSAGTDGPVSDAPHETSWPDTEALLGLPAAVRMEMQPPMTSVARRLALQPGQLAVMVTVRYDNPGSLSPVALMVAAVRPDFFRIVIESAADAGPLRPGDCADVLDDQATSMTDESASQGEADSAVDGGMRADGLHASAPPTDSAAQGCQNGNTTNGDLCAQHPERDGQAAR